MAMSTKVAFKAKQNMDLVYIDTQMAMSMKVNGKMINNKARVS